MVLTTLKKSDWSRVQKPKKHEIYNVLRHPVTGASRSYLRKWQVKAHTRRRRGWALRRFGKRHGLFHKGKIHFLHSAYKFK